MPVALSGCCRSPQARSALACAVSLPAMMLACGLGVGLGLVAGAHDAHAQNATQQGARTGQQAEGTSARQARRTTANAAAANSETQAGGEAISLAPVTVIGERGTGPVNGYVANYSTTASFTGQPIAEIPQSVSVIGREEMTQRNVQTTTQAVQYTPGVFASNGAASQRFDYFSIRGFDATLNGALLDGLRSTTAQSYVRYQPYGMERTEILRGPSGFMYGAGSPGGVVNMISKRPTEEVQREVAVQYGSFDRWQGQFDFSGPVKEDKSLLFRFVGVGRQSDTQMKYVPDNTGYLAPSFTWAPNDNTSLTVLASISRDEFGPPRPFVPIKGTLLANPNGPLRWNTYLDGAGLDNYVEQANIAYILDHRFNDVWSVQSSSRFAHTNLFTQTLSGMGLAADMMTLNRSAYQFGIEGNIFSTNNMAKAEWSAGPLEGTSVFGISYRHGTENYYLNFGRAESINIYFPTYTAPFSATTPFTKTYQTAAETGIFTANTITVAKRVVLDLSARQDWVTVDTDNRLKNTSTRQNDDDFTYRAGMTLLTDFGASPYVSYATSFAPVLGTDFYGEAYKPTTGKQWEVGLKYQPTSFDGLFTIAWYNLEQDNVRTQDPNNPLNSVQTGQVTSRGLELSAVANVTTNFNLRASYTYMDLTTTKTTVQGALGKVPTGMPEHMASGWADYRVASGPFAGWGFGAGVRYVGETFADTSNTIIVPAFTLVDAAIRYEFGQLRPELEGLKLSVNATNLFNKQYYSTCSASSCNYGFDRSVIATLSYRW